MTSVSVEESEPERHGDGEADAGGPEPAFEYDVALCAIEDFDRGIGRGGKAEQAGLFVRQGLAEQDPGPEHVGEQDSHKAAEAVIAAATGSLESGIIIALT